MVTKRRATRTRRTNRRWTESQTKTNAPCPLAPETGREVEHRLLRIHADGSDLAVGSRERRSQIDTPDRLVIVGSKMPTQIVQVGCAGPRGELSDGRAPHHLAHGAQWNIEIVEDMERLQDGLLRRVGCNSGLREGDGTHEPRRRCEVARQPVHPGALAELCQLDVAQRAR